VPSQKSWHPPSTLAAAAGPNPHSDDRDKSEACGRRMTREIERPHECAGFLPGRRGRTWEGMGCASGPRPLSRRERHWRGQQESWTNAAMSAGHRIRGGGGMPPAAWGGAAMGGGRCTGRPRAIL
jgi:hypothetical protein